MKVTYSGKTKDFTPQLEKKVEAKLAKLGKMIEQRGEKTAQVLHRTERHLHRVEIRTNFYDHALSAGASAADVLTAVCEAIGKLEKQIVKLRNRWRDTHRDVKGLREKKESNGIALEPRAEAQPVKKPAKMNGAVRALQPKIFRVAPDGDTKPMTLEEAIMVMQSDRDYIVYRDLDRSGLSVLFRRRDGNLDLIET